ncbi:MAG: restriction endonuclease subunit S [Moheibacter sp.]
MKEGYRKLGDLIQLVDERNQDLAVTDLVGLSISKEFIPSVANTIGSDMGLYKIIRKNQFACSLMQVRRDKKIPVALQKEFDKAIISQAYPVFEVKDSNELLPEYLMMWFSRKEFDREATFHAVGGVRGSVEWEDFADFELPVPSPAEQQKIIDQYHSVENKIKTNEAICERLEAAAQALYKHWFVDFEFPCLPENYKFSGTGEPEDYKSVLTYKRVGGLPIPKENTWFVYLILCENDSIYKGMTTDLYRRFYEHYTGVGADWAKTHKPVKVIHWEAFDSKEKAAKREKELKTGYGRTWIQRQIEKAGGVDTLISGLPASKTELRTAGKMIWNEELEKEIPEGWEVGELQEIMENFDSQRVPLSKDQRAIRKGLYPYYGAASLMDYVDDYIYDGSYILLGEDGSVVNDNGTPVLQYVWGKFWVNNHAHVLKGKNGFNENSLYILLKNINITDKITGGVQAKINQANLNSIQILIPTIYYLDDYNNKLNLIFDRFKVSIIQNQKLRQLQDLLLSRMVKIE